MAEAAITAYCDCVEQVQAGTFVFAFDDSSPWGVHAKEMLVRAAHVSHATRWKLQASERLRELVRSLVADAYKDGNASDFVRIADVDIDHGITPVVEIAARAEELVEADELQDNPDRRTDLWKVAARSHNRNRDEQNHNRCMIEVAECHVQKAESAGSPMLTSAFLNDAILVLRNYLGTKDRRDELTT